MSAIELRARRRAVALPMAPQGPEPGAVLVVCDFGPELDKALRVFNVSRRDPWFFRAAEVSPRLRFDERRWWIYEKTLQLFGLAHLRPVAAKLGLPAGDAGVVLTTDAATSQTPEAEHLEPDMLTAAAVGALRLQFAAGNAGSLLSGSGYRLGPLLRRAGR